MPETKISGCGGVTVPVIAKLNGFSSGSLLLKLICPLKVPTQSVRRARVKVSNSPGSSDETSPSMRSKRLGRLKKLRESDVVPSLRTVKVRCGPGWPCSTVPKSVWSVRFGVESPSIISTPLPVTATSDSEKGVTVPVTAKLNGFSSGSLLLKLTSPLNVPLEMVLNWTIKLSDSPGARDVLRDSTIL